MGTSPGREVPRDATAKTSVYLVCSAEPRVGKTLVARLCFDYLASIFDSAVGFDTNIREPVLASIFPRCTTVVDLASARGPVLLFDSLIEHDEIPKVVDLWHVSHETFFLHAEQLNFFEEAERNHIVPTIFVLADERNRFVPEVARLSAGSVPLAVALVVNHGVLAKAPETGVARHIITLPKLNQGILKLLLRPYLLYRFIHAVPAADSDVTLYLRNCLYPFFSQLEDLEVNVALDQGTLRDLTNSEGEPPVDPA